MALNYELGQIENWQELNETPGTVQTMCFLSMFTGMPVIEASGKDSWREWWQRIHMWETAFGPTSTSGPIGPEFARRFVGLRTNASRMTNTQFAKRVAEGLRNEARRKLDAFDREEADAAAQE